MPIMLVFLLISVQKDRYELIKINGKFERKLIIEKNSLGKTTDEKKNEKIVNFFNYRFMIQSDIGVMKKKLRFFKVGQIKGSSGRIEDWKQIFYNFDYNKNLIFGYGAQGDRYLINQTASNGLVYTFASSGIVGLIFFLTLTLASGIQVLKYLFFNKKKVLIHYFSFFIMVIFLIRSLAETSYSLFGIDLILFYTAFAFMQRNKNLE